MATSTAASASNPNLILVLIALYFTDYSKFGHYVANLAIQALHICVVSMADLMRNRELVYPIPMRFTESGEPFWASIFRRRRWLSPTFGEAKQIGRRHVVRGLEEPS